jgi:GR25 family glycosyltransferase involved in LPS biosynthesis
MDDKKISIITACKNRVDALKISLMSWLNFEEIHEIIITDWNSDDPINYLTEIDSRIKVIRVSDKQYFNQPKPLNLAAKIATGNYIMKVDADHIFNSYYNGIKKYLPEEGEFTCGSLNFSNPEYYDENTREYYVDNSYFLNSENRKKYVYAYSPIFRYLVGILFVKKEHFDAVGGYNENFGDCYAFEDEEICNRLELYGLKKRCLEMDFHFIHLPHPDKKRIENFKGFESQEDYEKKVRENLSSTYNGDELEWQVEYALSEKHVNVNRDKFSKITNYYTEPKSYWNIRQVDEQNYYAVEVEDKLNNVMDEFPSVYCVSLEECQERRDKLISQFKNYGIEPKFLISKRYSESNDKIIGKYLHALNDGTKGCCVSHLKMIKEWYNNTDEEYAFFCEDDLSLETMDYWDFTWNEFIEKIPDDVECVQLLTIRNHYDTFEMRPRYWDDWGATAYILTREGAKKIIDTYIKGNTYVLDIPNYDIMPLIENIIFAYVINTHTIPLFVENIIFNSTFENADDDVKNGQKNNHKIAHDIVLNMWKSRKKVLKEIEEIKNNIKVEKTELEKLLELYSLDTENPEHNFNLGVWYENQGHTAPALSYFLRCAERGLESDPDLSYEALIRGSSCYFKQGTRDGSGRGMLWQAQMFLPKRPEAYYLLARYASKNEWWQDTYSTTQLALMVCDFDLSPLRTDVDYPGKYGILYEKSVSAWWWGKEKETRNLLQEIKNHYHDQIKNKNHFDTIQDTLIKLSTGYISEDEIKYNKYSGKKLKFNFEGSEKIEKNYSQSFQDLFVLSALKGKQNGLYLEIGAQEPFYQNNTALLETEFGWDGISVEIKENLCKMFSEQRKNKILCADATQVDYLSLLNEFDKGTTFDYLQLDCEPSEVTYQILLKIPFDHYKFAIITYEHDHYVDLTNSYRTKSREYLKSKGYEILVPNISPNECSPFEDWWYHPDLIDSNIVENMKVDGDVIDVRSYMIQSN